MGIRSTLPPDYDIWTFDGGTAVARRDVAGTVRSALAAPATLYAWAAAQPAREVFQGRGEAYGVMLGPARAVVRHARRGGFARNFSDDRFWGRTPRFRREIVIAERLRAAGIPTPEVLAGVMYPARPGHRADIATRRVDGRDLAAVFFGDAPPEGTSREAIWGVVGALVRRLHDAGFVHPDLQLRNVLVSLTDLPTYRLTACLLDVDTVRTVRLRPAAARQANLARFFRSWTKHNAAAGERLGGADRAAFLTAYDSGSRL